MDTWRRSIGHWLQNPGDEKVLIATSILLDGRTVYGPAELDARAILLEPANRATLSHRCSALRWRRSYRPDSGATSSSRAPASTAGPSTSRTADCFPSSISPDSAALKAGAKVTATIERLRAASELGAIEPAHARTLEEAYDLFSALRLEHQIHQLERGNEPNDYVDPNELSELTRRYLRDAFREVAAVQKSL